MIVVHDGRAHADDFLAACVCAYKLNMPVVRAKFEDHMLGDPSFWVLDQGRRFDPDLHNFDHHQIEEEKCAFTMVLDYLYGPGYRDSWPALRYVEILDSYGPKRAATFAGVPEESMDVTLSPIHSSVVDAFSKIEGRVPDFFLRFMEMVGSEVCSKIESRSSLFASIDAGHRIFVRGTTKILDVSNCSPPEGFSHAHLPTKEWSKVRGHDPEVILTKDPRQGGYRMVSINTDSLRFAPNPKAYFTHNSGFLTAFVDYDDHLVILDESSIKGSNS
jgi:hypothetical protein